MATFTVEHRFPAAPDAVLAESTSPDFYAGLELENMAPPTVLERTEHGTTVRFRVRMAFARPVADPIARRVVGSRPIAWEQIVELDTERLDGTLRVIPEFMVDRFRCSGTVKLRADGDETVRRIALELRIGIPIIGGRAERSIGRTIVERLNDEASALQTWLAG